MVTPIVSQSQSPAPPTAPMHADEVALLLKFVRDRDVHCPRCDYNLRNLTQPVCPECREALQLKIGVRHVQLAWLLLTLAPGMFCAIAGGLFVVMCLLEGPPPAGMWEPYAVFAFLLTSGLFAILIALGGRRFLRLSDSAQTTWMLVTWLIHILAFLIVVTSI